MMFSCTQGALAARVDVLKDEAYLYPGVANAR